MISSTFCWSNDIIIHQVPDQITVEGQTFVNLTIFTQHFRFVSAVLLLWEQKEVCEVPDVVRVKRGSMLFNDIVDEGSELLHVAGGPICQFLR